MKKLLLSFLLSSIAVPMIAMDDAPKKGIIGYVQNKTKFAFNSIVNTVKSDLGLADIESYKKSYSLIKDIAAGCRLAGYTYATRWIFAQCLNKTTNFFNDLPAQHGNHGIPTPNPTYSNVGAPIIEELISTYFLSNLLEPDESQIFCPLIFGAMHYHPNLKRWAFNCVCTSMLSFYNIRYLQHSKTQITLAPIFSHMILNAFGKRVL